MQTMGPRSWRETKTNKEIRSRPDKGTEKLDQDQRETTTMSKRRDQDQRMRPRPEK